MPWSSQYSVSLEELDSQHRYFIGLLDQVESAAKSGAAARFPSLVMELLRYTKYHFASEEAFMAAYGYSGAVHREEHGQLLARVEAMADEAYVRPATLRLFLYNWLVSHIQLEDLELAKFVIGERRRLTGLAAVETSLTRKVR
jgi:hemerythrin